MTAVTWMIAPTAAAVVASLIVVTDGAFADPGTSSHVDEVTAAQGSAGVSVTGRATFVDVPVVVGEDPKADAVGSAVPLGQELTTATIARPDPFTDTVRFTLGVANQPPQLDGVPELLAYQWPFTVSTDSRNWVLYAWRTRVAGRQSEPYFALFDCSEPPQPPQSDRGVGSCFQVRQLAGTMGDEVVTWDVPMSSDISAQPGGVISSDGIAAVFSTSFLFSGGVVYDEVPDPGPYTVPGPTVRLGIAPAGTPAQNIPLTMNAAVDAAGGFRGLLPAPVTPGEYTVAAQACHGTSSCGTATTTVTIS